MTLNRVCPVRPRSSLLYKLLAVALHHSLCTDPQLCALGTYIDSNLRVSASLLYLNLSTIVIISLLFNALTLDINLIVGLSSTMISGLFFLNASLASSV